MTVTAVGACGSSCVYNPDEKNQELMDLCYQVGRSRRKNFRTKIRGLIKRGADPLYIEIDEYKRIDSALDFLFKSKNRENLDLIKLCLGSPCVNEKTLNAYGRGIRILNQYICRESRERDGWGDSVVQILLEKGLDINNLHEEGSPLLAAVSNQMYEIVEILLQAGINPTHVDKRGRNALHLLNSDQAHRCMQILLHYQVPLEGKDKDGNTPLLAVARTRNRQFLVSWLLQEGADLSARNNKGKNFLDVGYSENRFFPACAEEHNPFLLHYYFYPECKRWADGQLQRDDLFETTRSLVLQVQEKSRDHFRGSLMNVAISAVLQHRINYRAAGCVPLELQEVIAELFSQKLQYEAERLQPVERVPF